MLLLPSASHPLAGPVLALSSTLAGNLFIVGSIANIIVVDQAGRLGVAISWREHAKVGVPVTLLTLAIAAGWLALQVILRKSGRLVRNLLCARTGACARDAGRGGGVPGGAENIFRRIE